MGKMVKVAYKGFFDDGSVFIDQTEQPIEFPCLDGWMPPAFIDTCLLYTSPSPRDVAASRMPSSA